MKKLIDMKDARVIWNRNEQAQIKELIVAEFITPTQNAHLYENYTSDVGNCRSDWDQWRVEDLIHYIFVCHDFETHMARMDAFQEICKIKEISDRFPAERNII